MKYCCDGMTQMLANNTKDTIVRIQRSPELDDDWIFTIIYTDRQMKKSPRQLGFGFKGMRFCPFCGEKLK